MPIYVSKGGGGGTDDDAIHDNVAGEIAAIAEKTAPVAADMLLIEDTDAANAKKRVQLGSFPLSLITEGARVYNASATTLPSATITALAMGAERYDTNSIHDTAINNSRLTIKTAGKYAVGGCVYIAANTTGYRSLRVRLGGSTDIVVARGPPDGTNGLGMMAVHTIYEFSVNEYVELMAQQFSGGGTLDTVITGNYSTEFWIQKVG